MPFNSKSSGKSQYNANIKENAMINRTYYLEDEKLKH